MEASDRCRQALRFPEPVSYVGERSVPGLDIDLTRDLAVSEVEDHVLDEVASVRLGHEEGEGDPLLADYLVRDRLLDAESSDIGQPGADRFPADRNLR